MQVKEAADPREMSTQQVLLLGCISVQQCQGWLQHRKERDVNEIHCCCDAGRHLTCTGETFSLKRWGTAQKVLSLAVRNMGTSIYSGHCGWVSGSALPEYG